MYDSLRPPPYASAVSNVVIPASQAASIRANACSSVSPRPKNAGDEPIPPKLPQPEDQPRDLDPASAEQSHH